MSLLPLLSSPQPSHPTTTTTTHLHPLTRPSGSATHTSPASPLTILAAINTPLEVPRRSDEHPTTLLIDVHIRPHDGVSTVRERHLETLVLRTLRAVVRVEDYPRCLCQVVLQVLRAERGVEDAGGTGRASELGLLCGLLNATNAACVDGGVGMREVFVAVLMGMERGTGKVLVEPSVKERARCRSLLAFCVGGRSGVLLAESEGRFGLAEWERARDAAVEEAGRLLAGVRGTVEERVAVEQRWRQ